MTDYEQAKIEQMKAFNQSFKSIAESVFMVGEYFNLKQARLYTETFSSSEIDKPMRKEQHIKEITKSTSNYFKGGR